jgi:GNAT superfamily N-acetyltransferase
MDDVTLRALYDRALRQEIRYGHTRREVAGGVIRHVAEPPRLNFVLYSDLDESNADAAIQEQIAFFRQLGRPFEWKVYDHDRPADLRERLLRHGFIADEPDTIMVLDLEEAPAPLLQPVEADVRRLAHPQQLDDVLSILSGVYENDFDWVYPQLGGDMARPDYLSIYVAYVNDIPASTAWIYYYPDSQFAGLWGGSTLALYRRLGLYSALLAARVQEALRRGVRYLTIDASEMSRPIVSRHGFRLLARAHGCQWRPVLDDAPEEEDG